MCISLAMLKERQKQFLSQIWGTTQYLDIGRYLLWPCELLLKPRYFPQAIACKYSALLQSWITIVSSSFLELSSAVALEWMSQPIYHIVNKINLVHMQSN